MFTKHFFKILIIFLGMILAGIIGAYLISYFDKDDQLSNSSLSSVAE